MALALDGSVAGFAVATSAAVSLTTSNGHDMIFVAAVCNGGPVLTVTASGLTFTRRSRNVNMATNIELWWARAPAALSSVSITVTQSSSGFLSLVAFGVSGNPAAFDPNVLLPSVMGDGSGSASSTRTAITTSQNNAFLIGAYRFNIIQIPTEGSGWTKIAGDNFTLVEYKVVSAVQAATDVTITNGNNNQNGGVADAVTAGLPRASYAYGGA